MKQFFNTTCVLILIILSVILTSNPVYANDNTIEFADQNLKDLIIDTLDLSQGEVTMEDILLLTSLDTPSNDPLKKIRNLDGLQHATNLTSLNLDYNYIEDVTPLASLTNLTYLNISYNEITDISSLDGLTNLETFVAIYLQDVTDFSVVENFTKLTMLNLSISRVDDISFVSELTNLDTLYLSFNRITDISPLENLNNLEVLSLTSNEITDIRPLANKTKLTRLYINDNYIFDVSILTSLTELEVLDISRNFMDDFMVFDLLDSFPETMEFSYAPYLDQESFTPVTSIEITNTIDEIKLNETFQITVTKNPENSPLPVTFISSDDSIATVDAFGFIMTHQTGTVTITALIGDVSDSKDFEVVEELIIVDPVDPNDPIEEDNTVLVIILGVVAVLAVTGIATAVIFNVKKKNKLGK